MIQNYFNENKYTNKAFWSYSVPPYSRYPKSITLHAAALNPKATMKVAFRNEPGRPGPVFSFGVRVDNQQIKGLPLF